MYIHDHPSLLRAILVFFWAVEIVIEAITANVTGEDFALIPTQ